MTAFLSLDTDVSTLILSAMDTESLRMLARTCRTLNTYTAPFALRSVPLTRSPDQVISFLTFVLSPLHQRCRHVRELGILKAVLLCEDGDEIPDDDPFFAKAAPLLADFLERAMNLEIFSTVRTDCLLSAEPRIAEALKARPPSLRLRLMDMDDASCAALRKLKGVRDIAMSLIVRRYRINDDLAHILKNSTDTLEGVTLASVAPDNFISDKLSDGLCEDVVCPGVRSLNLLDAGELYLSPFQRMYPNARALNLSTGFPVPIDGAPEKLREWSSIEVLDCRLEWISILAPVTRLKHLNLAGWVETDRALAELLGALRSSPLQTFVLWVDIKVTRAVAIRNDIRADRVSGINGKTFPRLLCEAVPRVQYLDLMLTGFPDKAGAMLSTISSKAALAEFAQLKYLKYLALRAATPYLDPVKMREAPDAQPIALLFASRIASLEYFELEIGALGWRNSFWRVMRRGGNAEVLSVSKEEGESAIDYYQGYAFHYLRPQSHWSIRRGRAKAYLPR